QASTGRNAAGNAREGYRFASQKLNQVTGGGFAFHVGRQSENDFRNLFAIDAFQQFPDSQILRTDVIERRDFSAQRMVAAAKSASFFQRQNVRRLFHDAEQMGRA